MYKQLRSLSLCFILCGIISNTYAQDCEAVQNGIYLHGNNVRAFINNSGSLYQTVDDGGAYQVPYTGTETPSTIFAQGVWLGNIKPSGQIYICAHTYGFGSADGVFGFLPGPLDENGNTMNDCPDWDKVWSVTRFDIENHQADYADNNLIDEPIPAVFAWPGYGNPYFLDYNGFSLPGVGQEYAPFSDVNNDGIYNPADGDFPSIIQSETIPQQITWTVFNDLGVSLPNVGPLQCEIQLTSWAFNCAENEQLNNATFNSYKIINRSQQSIDSLYFGLWNDFDLGCYTDDYLGSAPELNTMYVYNRSNQDGMNCPTDYNSFGNNPPVQAITVLNNDLTYFMHYNNGAFPSQPPGTTDPGTITEYYNYLTGRWRDGSPLTYGGNGYDPTGNNPPTAFAYPDDPNDPQGWSQFNENPPASDVRSVGSIYLGDMQAGEVKTLDFAHSYFRESSSSHLQNVTRMYQGIPDLQEWYATGFEDVCTRPDFCEEDCVWPGDTNADGIANNCDLLPIGLELAQQGPLRAGPYIWAPKAADLWMDAQFDGTNNKHVDANGNGQIEASDFDLTIAHYHRTRPDYQPSDTYNEGPEIFVQPLPAFDFEDMEAGESFLASVRIVEVPDLFGLSFSIEYDQNYFAGMEPLDNGFAPTIMQFMEDFPTLGSLDYAYIPTDNQQAVTGGALFLMRVKVQDNLPDPLPDAPSLIRFKNVKGVMVDGTPIELGGTTIAATFQDSVISNNQELVLGSKLEVFPNPTTDILTVQSKDLPIEAIQLVTISGKEVLSQAGLSENQLRLSIGHLPKALYLLKLKVGEQVAFRKIVVE